MSTENASQAPTFQLSPRPQWLALRQEPPLEPTLPIIDAHHHLVDSDVQKYLWPDLRADILSGHSVKGTVFITSPQAMSRSCGPVGFRGLGEVEYATNVAIISATENKGVPWGCAGVVGCADLLLGEKVIPVLEAMIEVSDGKLCGIRNNTAWHEEISIQSNPYRPSPSLILDTEFQRGSSILPRFNLALDVWVYQTQLSEVYSLARSCPDLTVIINHVGGPLGIGKYMSSKERTFQEWKANMERLATLPNTVVKLGGLGMKSTGLIFHERELPPTSVELADAWRAWIHTTIETFGVERCMFESNFPVDKGMCSYVALWNAFKILCHQASVHEKQSLFFDTAQRVYRLPLLW